jgi:hypothetical protein
MKKADFLSSSIEPTHKIDKDAVSACITSVELLVLVGRNKELSCWRRQTRCGTQELASAYVDQIEV